MVVGVVGDVQRAAAVERHLAARGATRQQVDAEQPCDVARGRAPGDLPRLALLRDRPAFEHHDPVGQDEGVERVVRHEERRSTDVGEVLAQPRPDVEPRAGVERRQRLVEQQRERVRREGATERDPLRLPS